MLAVDVHLVSLDFGTTSLVVVVFAVDVFVFVGVLFGFDLKLIEEEEENSKSL